MEKLIPFNQESADILNQEFSGTLFRSTEDFITFYNSGLINKTAEDVTEFAAKVDETFKNVKLQGKSLVFISPAEVYIEEISNSLLPWQVATKVKRILMTALNEKLITPDSQISLHQSYVNVVDRGEDLSYRRLSEEKLSLHGKPIHNEMLFMLHKKFSHDKAEGYHMFVASDFLNLNEDFLKEAHSIVV